MENEIVNRILDRGIISYFVFEDLDKDRSIYEGINEEDFISDFVVSDALLNRFNDYLNARTRFKIVFVAYNDEIKFYIKATFAQQLYGSEAYQKIVNTNDVMIDKIKQLIQESK